MKKKLTNHKFDDRDILHQHGDKRPVPATSTSSPFTVPQPARPTEQRDRERLMASSVNSNSLAGHRYTNHDRMNTQPSAAATLSSVGQASSNKTAAQATDVTQRVLPPLIEIPVSQPPLRRIKTESGALSMSTKQYFQRRERERLERDAAKTELQPVKESVKVEQEPSKSSPRHIKAESNVVQSEQRNKTSGSEMIRKTSEMKQTAADGSYKQQNMDLKTGSNHSGQHQNLQLPASRGLGMGDPSDQRPANIFESFQVNDLQKADGSLESGANASSASGKQQSDEITAVDNIDLGAILKPEHVHGGGYSLELPVFTTASATATSSTAVAAVHAGNSSLSSHGHHAAHSDVVNTGSTDRPRQRVHGEHSRERRRSARHEGGVSVTSLTKPQNTDQADVKKHDQETSQRRAPGNSSQPSPLKMKLSLSGASRTGSPSVVKQPVDTQTSAKLKSHVSSPALETQTPSLSDSQEHIRLKLNISSGKVEKLGNAAASPGMKLVLSKDKVSGEYQHGSGSRESGGHHHHHHRHRHHHHHHKHSRPDSDSHSAHMTVSRKRAADTESTAKPMMEKKLRSELLGNGHQFVASGRLSQPQSNQANNVAISSGVTRTHIPSTYRVSGISSIVPPPPPPPLPSEEPAAPPPPPLPPQ